ncbi:DUF4307 domain-containing protein [Gulosibacter sp. ACHW.36C]|uniref:DUF4307 domain-containing protein n=1 Tax=Gulosibacter sediminis TaxID=1729695 RepID=A0ABY4MZ81_9MICO|nr:DUF4307 domain-containing protein [Gulosibacter sediminis]UQN15755.1 DUF4307 domain-containing protein [Gulosibacter sediminis]
MTDLDARYGKSPRASRRRTGVSIGVAVALVIAVVVFWALTALNPGATIEAQTGGFTVGSPSATTVTARVSVQPGTPVACAIQASNESSSIVGYQVVELEPQTQQHQTVHVTLRTTSAADTAEVRECWVNESSTSATSE